MNQIQQTYLLINQFTCRITGHHVIDAISIDEKTVTIRVTRGHEVRPST